MPSSLTVERYGPAVFAALGAIVWFICGQDIPARFAKELLSAILSAAAISCGFLTTALTIIMSLGTTAVGRRLARRGKMPYLYKYLKSAIVSCLVLSAVCVAGFFFSDEITGIATLPSSVIMASTIFAGAAIYRIVDILIVVMRQVSEPEDLDG